MMMVSMFVLIFILLVMLIFLVVSPSDPDRINEDLNDIKSQINGDNDTF